MVITVAVITAVAAVIAVVTARPTEDSTPTFHRGDWQPPPQLVLSTSMRRQPIPGWRTSLADLGLPESSNFGTSDDHLPSSTPLIGSVGSNGYFLASSPTSPGRQQWLLGVDSHTGKQLFPPVPINAGSLFPNCFVNGPEFVLCLADDVREGKTESTAWVIDTHTGELVFNGPTELHTTPGSGVNVEQVGAYAVASIRGEGIYGVGPRAETTWFIPHADSVTTKITRSAADTAPPTLATAQDSTSGSDDMVVFSLVDGTVMTLQLEDEKKPETAVVYPGGFAIQAVAPAGSRAADTLLFYDHEGNRIGETDISGSLSPFSMVLPIVESLPVSTVFGANGAGLIQLPDRELTQNAVFVGHRLFAPESNWEGPVKVRKWRQFDLTTGEEQNACRSNMSGYLANDSSVGVFETNRFDVTGATTFAMDLTTCEKLWTMPVNPDSFHRLWRINDTLVELSDDGKELHSLVAPR